LKKDPVEGFSAGLRGGGDDIYKWRCSYLALLIRLNLKKDPVKGFSAGLRGGGDDIYNWEVLILGPPDTP
uniref:UBC core domain-containing protein n=1 Tax=Toxocara canis TaxID=6265 RepID=A0A183VHL4_TOXCA